MSLHNVLKFPNKQDQRGLLVPSNSFRQLPMNIQYTKLIKPILKTDVLFLTFLSDMRFLPKLIHIVWPHEDYKDQIFSDKAYHREEKNTHYQRRKEHLRVSIHSMTFSLRTCVCKYILMIASRQLDESLQKNLTIHLDKKQGVLL